MVLDGGFANIWVGHWESGTDGPRKVAIKVLRTYTENQKHNRRMDKLLCNEIRVWRRLEHINVLPLYGTVSNFGPCVSMVCPWQENGNLNQFLEMNPTLASHGRYRILLGVLSGLLYLHSCSVIHGDLTGVTFHYSRLVSI
ncbi:kinase-like domain-containing protein [Infundibulicybe gibba]|nr:kinase-like domain-containing protein [Infundibulicybe gibba]